MATQIASGNGISLDSVVYNHDILCTYVPHRHGNMLHHQQHIASGYKPT